MSAQTTEIQKRPEKRDDVVTIAAAKAIAPQVMEWLRDSANTLDEIESHLVKAMKYNADGYDIARALDMNYGYSPNAELVEILDGCDFAKHQAHDALCREWVIANGIKEIPLQTNVTWSRKPEACVGTVVKNWPEGKSTVSFPALGHVPEGQIGCLGFIVEWEQLTPEPVQSTINS